MAKKKKPTKKTRSQKPKTASRASSSPKRSPKKKATKKKVPSKKTRAKPARAAKKTANDSKSAGAKEVTIDRRRKSGLLAEEVAPDNQAATEPIATEPVATKPTLERRKKVNRRRQIDPTTCERDYSDAEVEFMNALDDYKRKNGRMFPTCSEVLEVIRELGYIQLSPAELAAQEPSPPADTEMPEAASESILPTFQNDFDGPMDDPSDPMFGEPVSHVGTQANAVAGFEQPSTFQSNDVGDGGRDW